MMGRIAIQIAYGERIWNALGKDLVSLNKEAVGFISDNLNRFWLVDIFHFCGYSFMPHTSKEDLIVIFKCDSYLAGCLEQNSSEYIFQKRDALMFMSV
jgi:hypothetical protein